MLRACLVQRARVPQLVALGLLLFGLACDPQPPADQQPLSNPIASVGDEPTQSTPGGSNTEDGTDSESPGSSQSGVQSPTDEEIIAAILSLDSDRDGVSDGDELAANTDPLDPTEADEDGDGVLNRDDPDVDGDGIENAEDDDIDGDGDDDGDDNDIDGDGLENDEDDDDDGDGDPDETDNDEDGDGEPDCDCENGRCSAFGGFCFCDPGWEGESCDEFHCHDLRDCLNGTCVGPSTCRCNSGWESSGRNVCNVFHCRNLRNCNGHGRCIGPDMCECDQDWRGGLADCSIHSCDRNPSLCDDGNLCTIDECDPRNGCSNRQMTCLGFDVCVGGNCVTSCGNASGCDDGQACRDGGCVDECERARDCNDNDQCTDDGCDANMCVNTPINCTSPEVCKRGVCVGSCTQDSDCGMGKKCKQGGCFDECDDGECDMDEQCEDDACVPVGCTDDDDCGSGETCDDNHACVQDE